MLTMAAPNNLPQDEIMSQLTDNTDSSGMWTSNFPSRTHTPFGPDHLPLFNVGGGHSSGAQNDTLAAFPSQVSYDAATLTATSQ